MTVQISLKRNDWIFHAASGRTQISGHSDFRFFNDDCASSILTWVWADAASAACPAHPGSLAMTSMTFCSRHLWRRWAFLREYCIRARIIFYGVTSQYNSAFVFLKLWFQLGTLGMTDVHKWREVHCSALIPCVSDHLFLVSDFRQTPCRNFLQFFQFFIHCIFRI